MHFQRRSEDRQGHSGVIQWDLCQPRAGGGGGEQARGEARQAGRHGEGRIAAGLLSKGSQDMWKLRPPHLLQNHPLFAPSVCSAAGAKC